MLSEVFAKGGYYYAPPTATVVEEDDDGQGAEKPPVKKRVEFNLLIKMGDRPSVQVLPDKMYTMEYVKERMCGEPFVYLRACYDGDTLYDLGPVP